MKHLNCKLYYQQLHLKYLCNLARYWLQAVWGWHDSVETCSSVIICEIIVHLLVIVQNKKQTGRSFSQIPKPVRAQHTVTCTTTHSPPITPPPTPQLFNIIPPHSPYNSAVDGTLQNNQTIKQQKVKIARAITSLLVFIRFVTKWNNLVLLG